MATFHRLSVAQYHQMIAHGILLEGEPIELIEGYLVEKMSRGTPTIPLWTSWTNASRR